jgi:hypothetical protein
MNVGMLRRAIARHRHTKDRPAYERFLNEATAHANVWKAPQREIAAWWESRQTAMLELEVTSPGTLSISCALARAAVEIDGSEIIAAPFARAIAGSIPIGRISITYRCAEPLGGFAREMLGHLGFGHLRPADDSQTADLGADIIDPILCKLRETALKHWAYDPSDRQALRGAIAEAHHRRGMPEFRIWTLPQRDTRPYRVALSPRFDVDNAIVNMPLIHDIEARYGIRSTAYLRPMGIFYGGREIRDYKAQLGPNEIALHGEFVTTARARFGDEMKAAAGEKARLEFYMGGDVEGVCMHGGELTYNYTEKTHTAIESAGFRYDTTYRNGYYLPLHLPDGNGVKRCLTIGQHWADLSIKPTPRFVEELCSALAERLARAEREGGVFVPVFHPLYFDIGNYLRYPENVARLAAFIPRYLGNIGRMRRDAHYLNRP